MRSRLNLCESKRIAKSIEINTIPTGINLKIDLLVETEKEKKLYFGQEIHELSTLAEGLKNRLKDFILETEEIIQNLRDLLEFVESDQVIIDDKATYEDFYEQMVDLHAKYKLTENTFLKYTENLERRCNSLLRCVWDKIHPNLPPKEKTACYSELSLPFTWPLDHYEFVPVHQS